MVRMRDQAVIHSYLREVDAYLHIDRTQRRRVRDEIEGHLCDAVDAHVASGVQPDLAVEQAVEELGAPSAVAMQLSVTAWNLSWVRGGLTLGEERAQRWYVLHTVVVGALAAATYGAIRRADREPHRRRAAWFCAGLTLCVVVVLGNQPRTGSALGSDPARP
jgi:hypothetical protein